MSIELIDSDPIFKKELTVAYVLHTAQAIDRATLHRDRCPEVPENIQYHDLWTGTWQEIVDKERAYEALELSNSKYKNKCPLCKP